MVEEFSRPFLSGNEWWVGRDSNPKAKIEMKNNESRPDMVWFRIIKFFYKFGKRLFGKGKQTKG
jgi:hypothetical protein